MEEIDGPSIAVRRRRQQSAHQAEVFKRDICHRPLTIGVRLDHSPSIRIGDGNVPVKDILRGHQRPDAMRKQEPYLYIHSGCTRAKGADITTYRKRSTKMKLMKLRQTGGPFAEDVFR